MAVRTNPDATGQRDVFDSGARARSSDPATSKAAAQSVRAITSSHQRVLAMFRAYGDMTDETLTRYLDEAARATGSPRMSPSGVRSRRSELSKPNMDRIEQIAREEGYVSFEAMSEGNQNAARNQLRREGFRSPLWDTGKRETIASGREATVWGIAR